MFEGDASFIAFRLASAETGFDRYGHITPPHAPNAMSDELRYCPECKENRYIKPKISWVCFIILLICGILLGLVYLLYVYAIKEKRCPVCGTKESLTQPPRPENRVDTV